MNYPAFFLTWLIEHYTQRLKEETRPEVRAYLRNQLFNFKRIHHGKFV